MTVEENVKLLERLRDYAKHKQKSRGGWYIQAVEDCIQTLEDGSFSKVRQRDREKE